MIEEQLEKIGLSGKEVRVYLALLKIDSAPVSDIAKKARINRSTAYILLESLSAKGLISISERKKIRLYTPLPPDRLVQMVEERIQQDTKLIDLVQHILPDLKSIYGGMEPKPKIQYFEGSEGVMSIYEDTLTSSETIRAYASIENMHAALPDYFPSYYQRRASKGISIRSIHPDTEEARERVQHNNKEARDSALVPHQEYDFSPEINIYDNKIAFMSLREKFGLIIESQELADAMKKIFELSWKEAKRLNTKLQKPNAAN